MRTIIITSVAMLLAGCATTKTNYQPVSENISQPEIGVESTARIGDEMLSQGTRTMTAGIELLSENKIGDYRFSPGFYPQIGIDKDWTYHSFNTGAKINDFGTLRTSGGLFGANANDAISLRASRKEQKTCVNISMGMTACDTEHAYRRTERPIVGENNFQQTLIYSGRVGDRIKIGYREFSGGMARAAFSNEVEYDLSQNREIGYKGARIRVLDADNEKIRYVVLSNFNTD